MEASIFVAKVLAVVYSVFTVGFILNKSFYIDLFRTLISNPVFVFFSGLIALLCGVTILNYQNSWENNWTTVITVFGWIATFKGVVLLVFPKTSVVYFPLLSEKLFNYFYLPILFGLSLLMIYLGFVIN